VRVSGLIGCYNEINAASAAEGELIRIQSGGVRRCDIEQTGCCRVGGRCDLSGNRTQWNNHGLRDQGSIRAVDIQRGAAGQSHIAVDNQLVACAGRGIYVRAEDGIVECQISDFQPVARLTVYETERAVGYVQGAECVCLSPEGTAANPPVHCRAIADCQTVKTVCLGRQTHCAIVNNDIVSLSIGCIGVKKK